MCACLPRFLRALPAQPGAPASRLMLDTFCFRGNPEHGAAKRTAQRRRRGAAEPRVEEHATAGSGTLDFRAECGFSPARHARQAKVNRGSAEGAAQQSPGWRSTRQRAPEPWVAGQARLSPERAAQTDCIALTGLFPNPCHSQGLRPGLCCAAPSGLVPCVRSSQGLRPGLCCAALSALELVLS
jgi:hypothetical protein